MDTIESYLVQYFGASEAEAARQARSMAEVAARMGVGPYRLLRLKLRLEKRVSL